MQLSCEHCLWWQHEEAGVRIGAELRRNYGRCHRFPPRAAAFPLTRADTFCGEFTPRTYASVARLAGAQLTGGVPEADPVAPPLRSREDGIDGEIAATIAAAVAMVIDGPHRIVGVEPVAKPAFGPWPLGAVLNTWAMEGRVQHFSSHRLR
jgi:hypothetical protein